jgi:hypothetical protein
MEGYIYLKKIDDKILIETSKENPLKYLKPIILLRVKNIYDVKNNLSLNFNQKYKVNKEKEEYTGRIEDMIKDFIKICNEKFELIEDEDKSYINKKINKDNLYDQNDDL